MKCRNCGHDNPEYSEVCENCAVPLRSEPQRDDDNPTWGYVGENKDVNFSFGRQNAEQSSGYRSVESDLGSDFDEIERQFTNGVGAWDDAPKRPAENRQRDRSNAEGAQRVGRVNNAASADSAKRSANNSQGAFAGGRLPWDNADANARREQPERGRKPVREVRDADDFEDADAYDDREPVNKGANKKRAGATAAPVLHDDYDAEHSADERARKRSRRNDTRDEFEDVNRKNDRKRGGASGLRAAVIVLAVMAVIAVGVLAYTLLNGNGIGADKTNSVIVNTNNPDSYYITVYSPAGSILVYEDSTGATTEQQVPEKGYVTFNVASNRLRPTTPIEGETCDIYPTVSVKNADGTLTKLEIPRITLKVPKLNASFETAEAITSDDGVIEIKGKVDLTQTDLQNNAPVVTVNGETVTPESDGSFAYTTKLDKGEYEIVGEIKLGGYMILRQTFKVTVNKQLTASDIISIPEEVETRVLNGETSIELTGTVPAGAVLQVVPKDAECTVKEQPTVDENGNFRFSVNLPTAAKCYELQLTATLADGTVYTRPFFVERPPVFNEYVPTVWKGDYSEMSKPIHITDLRGFVIDGTVAEITYDDDYLVATFTLNDGHTISIEYHDHYTAARANPLEVGKQYTLYGFSKGVNESGMLHMYIWFVKD